MGFNSQLPGDHQSQVGSMDWNNYIFTAGGMDGEIVHNDVRVRSHRGHHDQVRRLKWSASGQQLAGGCIDDLLFIWDRTAASSNNTTQWLHSGVDGDRCIKFWNSHIGACLNSIDTGSQVCPLLWGKNERGLLSSHRFAQTLTHSLEIPFNGQDGCAYWSHIQSSFHGTDGCTVASAAADETLWNVFGTAELAKPAHTPKKKKKVLSCLQTSLVSVGHSKLENVWFMGNVGQR
ncbi:hypothetical protein RJ641_007333 [Dillenia turbinata]|uniref:Uncharacterized protein n=1 Tax=Dillenia turbinata TaxID=194707 RepID=A0AAN8V2V2_9MAGN